MFGKALVGLSLLTLGTSLFIASVFYSLPSNVVADGGIKNPIQKFSINLAPQGWGSFTKPPSDPDLIIYADGTLENLMVTPQGRASTLFGLSRTQRAQGPEGANILAKLSNKDWHDCGISQDLKDCVSGYESSGKEPLIVENNAPIKSLCGSVLFSNSDPVPWSYRDLYQVEHLPRNITKVEVKCEE